MLFSSFFSIKVYLSPCNGWLQGKVSRANQQTRPLADLVCTGSIIFLFWENRHYGRSKSMIYRRRGYQCDFQEKAYSQTKLDLWDVGSKNTSAINAKSSAKENYGDIENDML